jgi:Tfp pilus assembly protein PilV
MKTNRQVHNRFGFTLLEVIVACAIFFMVAFAILNLVIGGLAQAKALEQHEPDAGMLAATLSLTNQLVEGVESGDFEDVAPGVYRDYRWSREINEVSSNGLFRVDFIVYGKSGRRRPSETTMSLLLFRPGSKPGGRFGAGATAGR